MGYYDVQQVCLNVHQITAMFNAYPQSRREFCAKCGAKTIYQCPQCSEPIKGLYRAEGIMILGGGTEVPTFCEKCGAAFPWAGAVADDEVTRLDPLVSIERLCQRLPLVIRQLRKRHDNRPTLDVGDEYDVQDLLHALLLLFFDDVRPEEYTPSYAGKSTRMDFLLKQESVVIETKMTRAGISEKQIGDELIIDIAHYREHPSCKTLVCLVYDPDHRIANPRGLERDLSKSNGLRIVVLVVPRGP